MNTRRRNEGKQFLIQILIDLIRDYPTMGYLRQIDPRRHELLDWLEEVLNTIIIDDKIPTTTTTTAATTIRMII